MTNDPKTTGATWIVRALLLISTAACIWAIVGAIVHGPSLVAAIGWPALLIAVNAMHWPRRKKPAQMTDAQVDEKAQKLTNALAQVATLTDRIDEAAAGYRRKLEGCGYSPTVAEQLAANYHLMLLQKFGGGTS